MQSEKLPLNSTFGRILKIENALSPLSAREGFVENMEARFRGRDGRIRVGLMSARVLRINQEDVILSITRDITERKRAEAALRESETKLQAIFNTVGTGIFIIDRDTQEIIEANQTAAEMTGLPREDYWTELSLAGLSCRCRKMSGQRPGVKRSTTLNASSFILGACRDNGILQKFFLKSGSRTTYSAPFRHAECCH